MASLRHNPWILCAYFAVHSLMFPMAIFPLFWTRDIGMSTATMLSVQAFFGLSIALFEFPSGYVADRLGHRRALVLGTVLIVAGWLLYTLALALWSVLIAELVLGVGFSLLSGADAALLYESLRAEQREKEFARWYGRMRTVAQLSEGASALLAGYLYARWSRLPMLVEVLVWAVALALALRLAPTPERSAAVEGHLVRMRSVVHEALVARVDLRAVLLLSTALALASYLPVWLLALYATGAGVEVAWLGPIWAGSSFLVALGAGVSEPLVARLGRMPVLVACVLLVALGYGGLALSHHLLGFLFFFCLSLVRGLHMPVLHHLEQQLAPEGDRASSVSLRSFLFRGSYVLLGPLVGLGVDRYGQHPVLAGSGVLMVALALATLATFARRVPAGSPCAPLDAA